MKLVLRLVETGIDGSSRSVDVLEIVDRSDPGDIAALGIILAGIESPIYVNWHFGQLEQTWLDGTNGRRFPGPRSA
jgi:hypothetical protein